MKSSYIFLDPTLVSFIFRFIKRYSSNESEVNKKDAEAIKAKLEAAGAKVELK